MPGADDAGECGEDAEAQGDPENANRNRIGALVDPLIRLTKLHLPPGRGHFVTGAERGARNEHLPPGGKLLELWYTSRRVERSGRSADASRRISGNAAPRLVQKLRRSDEDDAIAVEHHCLCGDFPIGLVGQSLRVVGRGVHAVREERPELGVLAITHYQRLLDELIPDVVHLLVDGRIVLSGGAELAKRVEIEGYEAWR